MVSRAPQAPARRVGGDDGPGGHLGSRRHDGRRRDDGNRGDDRPGGYTGPRGRRARRGRPAPRARAARRRGGHDGQAVDAGRRSRRLRRERRERGGPRRLGRRRGRDDRERRFGRQRQPTAPAPSAGCGKSGRPSGGKVEVSGQSLHLLPDQLRRHEAVPAADRAARLRQPEHRVRQPDERHRPSTRTTSGRFRTRPTAVSAGATTPATSPGSSPQYDDLMANYCIDKNRVFATAHSSGAQMLVNILSHKTDAAAPEPQGRRARGGGSVQRRGPHARHVHRRQDGQPAERRLRQEHRRALQDREHVRRHLEALHGRS